MNLTQRHLRMFVTTAAFAHVSRASEALHISQPALTRALQEFETQLGVALFRRTTRQIVLTAEGERFLPVAQRMLRDMELALAGVKEGGPEPEGTVTLAVGTAFACTVLPGVLTRFVAAHPGAQVRVIDDNSAGITARVVRGEADIGVGSPVGETAPLKFDALLSAPLGLLGHPGKFGLAASVAAQQLADFPLLKEAADTSIMQLLRVHGPDLVARMHRGVEVSSLAVQLALAREGVGVAVLSALGASHPDAEGLHFAPLRPAIRREVFLMRRREGTGNTLADALSGMLLGAVAGAPLHRLVRPLRRSVSER